MVTPEAARAAGGCDGGVDGYFHAKVALGNALGAHTLTPLCPSPPPKGAIEKGDLVELAKQHHL